MEFMIGVLIGIILTIGSWILGRLAPPKGE